MWWQKLSSKSNNPSEQSTGQNTESAVEASFDFERTLNELRERKEDIRPSDVVLFPEPLRAAARFLPLPLLPIWLKITSGITIAIL